MAKKTRAELKAAREWLERELDAITTSLALKVYCSRFPHCAEPCDECWEDADLDRRIMAMQIADEYRRH